jgi:hypothetical protein
VCVTGNTETVCYHGLLRKKYKEITYLIERYAVRIGKDEWDPDKKMESY